MPSTQRTPPSHQESLDPSTPHRDQPEIAATRVRDIDFHGDVIRVMKASDINLTDPKLKAFEAKFRQKNGQVKRAITRAKNTLGPMEFNPAHAEDIVLLRRRLDQIDGAMDALNDLIDEQSLDMDDEELQTYVLESEAHTPAMLDLRARVNAMERPLLNCQQSTRKESVSSYSGAISQKVDNTFRPRPLEKTATPAAFAKWKRELKIYVRRNGFEHAPVDEQRVLLNQSLTPEMEDMLERLCEPNDKDSLDEVIDCLQKHLEESNNLIAQRFAYFNCVQKPGESIGQYIVRFRRLGDYADFDNFSYNDNMVCRLLTGITDQHLRKKLLRLPKKDCKFENVKRIALTWEASDINAGQIESDKANGSSYNNKDESSVEKISTYKSGKRSKFNAAIQHPHTSEHSRSSESSRPQQSGQSCYNCGQSRHPLPQCPAREKTCNYCSKLGHFAKVCKRARNDKRKSSSNRPINALEDEQQSQDGEEAAPNIGSFGFHVFELDSRIQAPTPRIQVLLSTKNGARALGRHDMVPDTGAAVSVLPASFSRLWGMHPSPLTTKHSLRAANGTQVDCIGTLDLAVDLNGVKSEVVFFVCEGVRNIILSWMALKNLLVVSGEFPKQLISQVHTEVIPHANFTSFKNKCIHDYARVFSSDTSLSEMRGAPMRIHLMEDFDPLQVRQMSRPRPVPVPLREKVHHELMRMVQQGIIRTIQEPTDFVSPLVVVPKKDNTVRLVIDYTGLNRFIKRPNHPFPSVAEVRALIPPTATCFATLDAIQGYLQVPLHESSQPLTTFLTPWGRFCFQRAPMGLSCSGDVFCARGDQAFAGIPGMIKVVDDILIFADDERQLYHNVQLVLQAAKKHHITLSAAKFSIGHTVDFVGMTISKDSIRPDKKHFDAISNFPEPANKTDLRSFLGMANQFSSFSKELACLVKPLRPLLSKSSVWRWDDSHQKAFEQVRNELVQSSTLHCFCLKRPTRLLTDASRLNGLGYVLQQYVGDSWVLIACGSRFITETEANYAVFELEALAIVWAIQKCRVFLLGLHSFEVVTDHRPLVAIFNSTRLSKTDNPRILRLLQKVAIYSFVVKWTPGKQHHLPDALSRSPLPDSNLNIVDDEVPVQICPDQAILSMAREASRDPLYQDITHAVKSLTLSEVKRLPTSTHAHIRILASLWTRLSVDPVTGLVLLDASRVLVPKSQRASVIGRIHIAHQGITRTRARMQALYFWPGMSNQVVQAVQACQLCQKFRDEQPAQPLEPHPKPPRPFHAVSIDVFEYRRSFFMTYVDRFSGWPSVAYFQKSPSSAQVIGALVNIFKDFGIPNTIRHDGATPFVSDEFKQFMCKYNITDQLTSAYNPSSNGHAEASVKAMKSLIKKHWINNTFDRLAFAGAILEWRNTPRAPGNLSPAELVFARKLRAGAPCISYEPISQSDIRAAVAKNYNHTVKTYETINHCRRDALPQLQNGDMVRIRNTQAKTWDKMGTVVRVRAGGKSYVVEVHGRQLVRNRRFLKKIEQ